MLAVGDLCHGGEELAGLCVAVALDGVDLHSELVVETLDLLHPVDVVFVERVVGVVRNGVSNHDEGALRACRPRQLLAHLSQDELVALCEVAASGALDLGDEVAQVVDVGGEVDPLGDVAVHGRVAVVAVREDGHAQSRDVALEALHHVLYFLAHLLKKREKNIVECCEVVFQIAEWRSGSVLGP